MIISQWELRVETANLLKARENASNQVVFGFGASFLDQSHNEVKQNQSNTTSLSILSWKLL